MITCNVIVNNLDKTTLTMNSTKAEISVQPGCDADYTSRMIAFLKWVAGRDEPKQYNTTLIGHVNIHTNKDSLRIQLTNTNKSIKFSYHEYEMINWKHNENKTYVVALITKL